MKVQKSNNKIFSMKTIKFITIQKSQKEWNHQILYGNSIERKVFDSLSAKRNNATISDLHYDSLSAIKSDPTISNYFPGATSNYVFYSLCPENRFEAVILQMGIIDILKQDSNEF